MKPDDDQGDVPAIARTTTPRIPADQLDAMLTVEQAIAAARRRQALRANALPPRSRGRR